MARSIAAVLFRSLAGLSVLATVALPAGRAHACSCEMMSPAEGFARAQYVFTGTVAESGTHTWVVAVDRVWKGRETLTHKARLMDVYAKMDCESFFKEGTQYLFFAIVAKGPRDVFYHPQVCNWTSPLKSRRVPTATGETEWLEDLIVREHGPGEPPAEDSGSGRLP